MSKQKNFLTPVQQWTSFVVGVVLLALLFPSFREMWNSQEKIVQITMAIFSIPIFLLLIFSGRIAQHNPGLYKRLTGHSPEELSRKGISALSKDALGKYLTTLIFSLIVLLAGIILTLLISN